MQTYRPVRIGHRKTAAFVIFHKNPALVSHESRGLVLCTESWIARGSRAIDSRSKLTVPGSGLRFAVELPLQYRFARPGETCRRKKIS